MATNYELAQLAGAAYKPATTALPLGWPLLRQSNPDPSGYQGYAFARLDAAGNPIEIIIAHRGTEILTSQDRTADLQMAANQLPDQYQYARQFYIDVLNASGSTNIATTGHSLGGSLAQLLAADKGLQATTFNPYGTKDLIPALNSRYGLNIDPNATYNNITNHQTLLDGVSRLGSSSPFGSDQLGQMQTHVALTELPAAAMIAGSALMGGASVVAFPATYLAVEFYWSHSIDRFTDEVFPQEALVTQVGQEFKDFVRTLNDQINAVEQAGATAQANLQNDFLQLAGTAGQTYQDAVNATSSAMGQLADLLSAAEKSAVKIFLDFAFDFGDTINGIEQTIADIFSAAQRFIPRRDPLTLDLNGNGIETVPINATNPVYFDLTGEGVQTSVGWVAPNDGLLVLDRNGNGTIDDGTELFGDATPAYEAGTTTPSAGKTADGFEALAQEDTNGDGVVNSSDANFANLRVWQDSNQDGVSQDGELKTLAELGIESFNVASVAHSQLLANGNQIADTGTYTRTDGSTGTAGVTAGMADVNLAVDTFHRTFTDVIPTTVDTATLPDMQGSGVVRDLREAASIQSAEGATLATSLGQFAATTTRNGQRAQLDSLIADWGATSGFEDMRTKAAAHGYPLTTNLDAVHQARLNALEQFNGRGFYRMPWETTNAQSGVTGMSVGTDANGQPQISINMNGTQLALLDQAYSALKESVYDALLPQTRLKPYLDDIGLTLTGTTGIALDFTFLDTRLTATHTGNANTAVGDLLDLRRLMGDTLEGASWDGLALLTDWAATDAGDAAVAATLADFGYNGGIHTGATGTVDGGNANDVVAGQAGNDVLNGNYGNDMLLGGNGNDTLIGGLGNDLLHGGAGNDTYVFNAGDGNDTILETHGDSGIDTIQFGSGVAYQNQLPITAGDISLAQEGDALIFRHINGRDSVTVAHWFNEGGKNKLDTVTFADGRSYDLNHP